MGILDALTGGAIAQAGQQQQGAIKALSGTINANNLGARDSAADYLNTGYNFGRSQLGEGYDASTGAIKTGAASALDFLGTGTSGALDRLSSAKGTLTANGGAFAPLSELAARYGRGANLYSDALGINGADGNSRAVDAFHADPAYNWTRDQGIDAINRRANAAGMLQGGNANRDAITFASGLADKTYGSWLDRLKDYNPLELSATSGAATGNAGVNRDVAGLDVTGAGYLDAAGRAKAGIASGEGSSLADAAKAYFAAQSGLGVGQNTALANNVLNANDKTNSAYMQFLPGYNAAYKNTADAATAGGANQINLGMNLAKLAAGAAAGGMPGGGGGSFLPSSSFMNNSWGW